jgi:hypothetical protein
MKSIWNRLFLLFVAIALMPAAVTAQDHGDRRASDPALLVPAIVSQGPIHSAEWDYGFDADGRLWLAYYDEKQNLRFRAPDGVETELKADPSFDRATGLGTAMAAGRPVIVWRHKMPPGARGFYVTPPSGKGAPLRVVGRESVALTRIQVLTDSDGTMHFVWYGEAGDPESKRRYHVHHTTLSLDGMHGKEQRVLPGFYPAALLHGNRAAVFSHYLDDDRKGVIGMRKQDADGAFGDVVTIANVDVIAPYFNAFESAGRWFVTWVAQYGEQANEFLLEGAWSDDQGKSWNRFALDELRSFDFSRIEMVPDGQGRIHVAISARDPANEGERRDIYVVRSEDNGKTWLKARRLRAETLKGFNAWHPTIVTGTGGEVLAAWGDFRDMRPNVYFSYSTDHGKTWTDPLPIGRPGIDTMDTPNTAAVRGLKFRDGRYHLVIEQVLTDDLTSRRLMHYDFTLAELKRHGEAVESARKVPDEASLRDRVGAFWNAFIDEDYRRVYWMMDPFYRARVSEKAHLNQMGVIKYHSYEIKGVEIIGTVAKVSSTVELSVPEVRFGREKFSKERAPMDFVETWVFVDGEWHREFMSESTGTRFTPY